MAKQHISEATPMLTCVCDIKDYDGFTSSGDIYISSVYSSFSDIVGLPLQEC